MNTGTRDAPAWALPAVVLVSLLWRLPSLFDPPWVNDEGTYFAVVQAMAHGYRLYADVWENKPPAVYLLYSAVYHLGGPSLLFVRLIACGAAVALVYGIYRAATVWSGQRAALVAAVLAGLLLGVPSLEGTTANAEVFVAVLTLSAVYMACIRRHPYAAGVLCGCAILFKAVAVFDAAAIGLWLVLHHRSAVLRFGAGAIGVLAVTTVSAWYCGVLGAMIQHAFVYDLRYVGHTNGGGVPWLLGMKLIVMVVLTVIVRKGPFPYLWLVYATAGAIFGGRYFGHYALQVIPPLALSLAIVLRGREPVARQLLIVIPSVFVSLAALSAGVGWAVSTHVPDSILARRLQYYANFTRFALGQESYASYRDQIDEHVTRNIRVARIVRHMPAGRLLVWGNTPWVYVLSDRLPATAYTSAFREPQVPGETRTLRRAVCSAVPETVVVVSPLVPSLSCARSALRRHYRLRARFTDATVYVRAPCPAGCPLSVRMTARANMGTR